MRNFLYTELRNNSESVSVLPIPNSLVRRDFRGNVKVAGAVDDNDATSKGYVDTSFAAALSVDTSTVGTVKLSLLNAKRELIQGSGVEFEVNSGIKSIAFDDETWELIITCLDDSEIKCSLSKLKDYIDTNISTSVNTEKERAQGVEATLTTRISTEESRAKGVENDLEERVSNLESRGRFLSTWDSTTGTPSTQPTVDKYELKSGDYFIVNKVGQTNYKPSFTIEGGKAYFIKNSTSTTAELDEVGVNDIYIFDNGADPKKWELIHDSQKKVNWGNIAGDIENQTDLKNALDSKQNNITDLETIRSGAALGATAVQPSGLTPYRTASAQDVIDATKASITYVDTELAKKQDTIHAGTNITINGSTINAVIPSEYVTDTELRNFIVPNAPGSATVSLTKLNIDGTLYDVKPTSFIESASVSGSTLTLVDQDGSTVSYGISSGTGITITGTQIAVDYDAVPTKSEVAAKQDIIEDLSTIRSGATAGASAVQPEDIKAGTNVTINYDSSTSRDITINATDTTYTAGSGIAISEDNVISATGVIPTEFIKDASVSGKTLTLTKADDTTVTFDRTNNWADIPDKPEAFTPTVHAHTFESLTGKPTTLEGYGITDAQSKLSSTQMDAVNSGINSSVVEAVENHLKNSNIHVTTSDKEEWSGKQDALTTGDGINIEGTTISVDKSFVATKDDLEDKQDKLTLAQQSAVNSGIDSTKVGSYDTHLADTTKHITAAERTAWNAKQAALTAGNGININNNTISVDTGVVQEKLDEGTGISISGSTISVDTDVIQEKLVWGYGIDVNGASISVDTTEIQKKLTAGPGISISDANVISAVTSAPAWGDITGNITNQTDLMGKIKFQVYQESGFKEDEYVLNLDVR